MKTKLTAIIILLTITNSFAFGQKNNRYYYSIEGEKFESEKRRNIADDLFISELDLNLIKLLKNAPNSNNPEVLQKRIDGVKEMTTTFYGLVTTIREMDKDIAANLILHQQQIASAGIEIKAARAINSETFAMEEVKDVFNILVDFFNYLSNFSKKINSGEIKNIDNETIAALLMSKTKSLEEQASVALEKLTLKASTINNVMNENKKTPQFMSIINSNSFDSKEERDNYEDRMLVQMSRNINIKYKSILPKSDIKYLNLIVELISKNIKLVRNTDTKFRELKLKPSNKEYIANNKESFCLADLRDQLNYSIGMYEILDDYFFHIEKHSKNPDKLKETSVHDFRDSNEYDLQTLRGMNQQKVIKMEKYITSLIGEMED